MTIHKSISKLVGLLVCALLPQASRAEDLSIVQFRELLERVLEANPEIVKTALFRAEAVENARQAAEAKLAAANLVRQAQSPNSPMPTVGSALSDTVIVEVIDYRCPYCRLMQAQTAQVLRERPNVRIAYVITSILGKESETLARFALAADEQGKFKPVHEILFASAKPMESNEVAMRALATRTGVSWIHAKAAMNSEAINRRLSAMNQYWESLKQPGTPLTIVGKDVFPGVTNASEIIRSISLVQSSEAASQ